MDLPRFDPSKLKVRDVSDSLLSILLKQAIEHQSEIQDEFDPRSDPQIRQVQRQLELETNPPPMRDWDGTQYRTLMDYIRSKLGYAASPDTFNRTR